MCLACYPSFFECVNRFTIVLFTHDFNNKFKGVLKFPDFGKKGSPLESAFGKSEMIILPAVIAVEVDRPQEGCRLIQPIFLGAVRPEEVHMAGIQADPESGVG